MGLCQKEEKKFKVVEIKPINNNFNQSQILNYIIPKNIYIPIMNNNQIQQNNYNSNINLYLSLSYDFLKFACNIPEDLFDSRGDCLNGWGSGKSGPPNYLKDYIPP